MSAENVEMLRRAFEAYERGEFDAAVADLAPDCEYIASGTVPGRAGIYRGPEGYKEFFAWLAEEFSDPHAQIDELIDAGDSVVIGARLQGQGRQSGIPVNITFWQVWRYADGKFVHGQDSLKGPRRSRPPGSRSNHRGMAEENVEIMRKAIEMFDGAKGMPGFSCRTQRSSSALTRTGPSPASSGAPRRSGTST